MMDARDWYEVSMDVREKRVDEEAPDRAVKMWKARGDTRMEVARCLY